MKADSGLLRARIETEVSKLEGILIWAEEFVWQFSCFWGSGSRWRCGRWAPGGTAGIGTPLKVKAAL
jgi:hypothetical protein